MELIIVIAITGAVSVVVLPKFGTTIDSLNETVVCNKLMDDIRYVQNYAITNHTNTWVTIDTLNNSYSYGYYATSPSLDPLLIMDPSTNQPSIVLLDNYADVQLTNETFGGGFDFDWFGSPSNGGRIVINNSSNINVENETGYVFQN